jgi:hypothetical protein
VDISYSRFEVKASGDNDGCFAGYGSTFGNVDSYGDTVFAPCPRIPYTARDVIVIMLDSVCVAVIPRDSVSAKFVPSMAAASSVGWLPDICWNVSGFALLTSGGQERAFEIGDTHGLGSGIERDYCSHQVRRVWLLFTPKAARASGRRVQATDIEISLASAAE